MEVEIKLVCRNIIDLKKKLVIMGAVLVKTKRQLDTYYDHPAKVLVKNGEYLRIRKSGDKKTLAHHKNLADGINDECEIEMGEGAGIEELLKRLGFPKLGVIDKKREQYRLGDFNVCLDKVKGIGNFIEIELIIVDEESKNKSVIKCWQLAKKLGFSQKDKFDFWLCDIAVGKAKWPPVCKPRRSR